MCSVVASMMAAKGKRYSVDDFLPRAKTPAPRPRQSAREMMASFHAATDP